LFEAAAAAQLNIDAPAALDASGDAPSAFNVNGSVANTGTLSLADTAPAADDVTTVHGNYTGVAGSVLKLDTVLGDSSSASDRLVVSGDTTGTTRLQVTNVGGLGAATSGNGILVVQVNGASNASFVLDGSPLVAGQFSYTLHQVGTNWYLQSAALPPPPPPPPPPPAAGPVQPVPAMGEWGALGLASALAVAGLRRRRRGG
jgi:outer membrane autotransporter protein